MKHIYILGSKIYAMPSSQQVRIPETLESQNPGIRVAL